jgi:hypothetical protein
MTKKQKQQYRQTDDLRKLLSMLKKEKFTLDCGHHVTFNEVLGNNITVYNGKELRITCAECTY